MTDRERLLELAEAVVGVSSMVNAGWALSLAHDAISDDIMEKAELARAKKMDCDSRTWDD